MPEHGDAVRATKKPGAIHYICHAFFDGFKENGVITRVILKVRVLYEQNITSSRPESCNNRRALTLIAFMQNYPNFFFAVQLLQDTARAVFRTIIYDNNFLDHFSRLHPLHDLTDMFDLIIDRYDDREVHGVINYIRY